MSGFAKFHCVMLDADEVVQRLNETSSRLAKKVPAAIEHWKNSRKLPGLLSADSPELLGLEAFLETAEELSGSEFLSEDDKCTLHGQLESGSIRITGARFGKNEVFVSALVVFRRLWLNDELSNFARICRILMSYMTDEHRAAIVAQQNVLFQINKSHRVFEEEDLTTETLINLWLNSRVAHIGTRTERSRLAELEEKFTPQALEYEVRHAIKLLCAHIVCVYRDCAVPELAVWAERYGIKITQTKLNLERGVERRGGGDLVVHETVEQTFSRVIDRDRFRNLKGHFFRAFRLDRGEVIKSFDRVTEACRAVSKTRNFSELLKLRGIQIITKKPRLSRICASSQFRADSSNEVCEVRWINRDIVWFSRNAFSVLSNSYTHFCTTFTSECTSGSERASLTSFGGQ